jgi:hypothetical protein
VQALNKLESMLRKAGRELADHQVCRFFKVPEGMQQTPCDFFGYTRVGQAVMIEAKMVNRPSLPISDSPGLQPHQWNELLDAHRAGVLAIICWAKGSYCASLTMDIALRLSKDRLSIPWNLIPDTFMRPMFGADAHLHLLDFLFPLETA